MPETTNVVGGTVGEYKPPKMWKDLSVEEKVERMRDEIKHFFRRAYNGGLAVGGISKLANPDQEAKGEVYF